ncbi:partial NADH-quinone oxidoreductase subunit N, partial [Candidatus Brocadiaceae bacterium]
ATLVKEPFFVIGMVLFIIGFAFKIAAFPFHMWVPDVYQGAPTTVTALMSTGGKAAAFSALILVLYPVMSGNLLPQLLPVLTVLAILSMLYGSIVAISQNDIKRMLTYSSIAHAGYMLIGLASGNSDGYAGIVFYLAAYAFMNLGAFGIISIIEGKRDNHLQIPEYAGLGFSYPVLAGLLALFMFALSGIPPFAGFFGKYYVFYAALQSGNTLLAIMGVLSSVISVYFYLRIIVVMYFNKPEEAGLRVSSYSSSALLGVMISAMLVVVMGVVPGRLIDLITAFLN